MRYIEIIVKFNPYHSTVNGQFTSGTSMGAFAPTEGKTANGQKLLDQYKEKNKGGITAAPKEEKPKPVLTESERITKTGLLRDPYAKISLDGCDEAARADVIETFELYAKEFPEMKNVIRSCVVEPMPPNTYGSCYSARGQISLNSKYFSNSTKFTESHKNDESQGHHPSTPATGAKAVVTHEMAHAMEGYIMANGYGGATSNGWKVKIEYPSESIRRTAFKESGVFIKNIKTEVSYYASTNTREFFAEAITEALLSPNPRPVALNTLAQTKAIMKSIAAKKGE